MHGTTLLAFVVRPYEKHDTEHDRRGHHETHDQAKEDQQQGEDRHIGYRSGLNERLGCPHASRNRTGQVEPAEP